jgi:hypothetical protein
LNSHKVAPASPSSWCVCQFRHSRPEITEKQGIVPMFEKRHSQLYGKPREKTTIFKRVSISCTGYKVVLEPVPDLCLYLVQWFLQ